MIFQFVDHRLRIVENLCKVLARCEEKLTRKPFDYAHEEV